jgi:integrase
VLDEHEARARSRAEAGGVEFNPGGYMFSPRPDGSVPFHPDTVSRRYGKLAKRLGIDTSLKNLRHYNATELIMADHNMRTVAGRLGHAGGGTSTLRVYIAWRSEADQRAADVITTRMPPRPTSGGLERQPEPTPRPSSTDEDIQPYQRIAADLRGAIDSGILAPGDRLPPETTLAVRYGVAPSTAHRAVAVLVAAGLVSPARGKRPTLVLDAALETPEGRESVVELRPQA